MAYTSLMNSTGSPLRLQIISASFLLRLLPAPGGRPAPAPVARPARISWKTLPGSLPAPSRNRSSCPASAAPPAIPCAAAHASRKLFSRLPWVPVKGSNLGCRSQSAVSCH